MQKDLKIIACIIKDLRDNTNREMYYFVIQMQVQTTKQGCILK